MNEKMNENFPVWRTITLRRGLRTADGFRMAFKHAGINVGDAGDDLLDRCVFAENPEDVEIDLSVVSVAELGFGGGTTRGCAHEKGQELGLDKCTGEIALQLRLQYTDQSKDGYFSTAMDPIVGLGGRKLVFDLWCDGDGLWLMGNHGGSDDFLLGHWRLLFVRRRQC